MNIVILDDKTLNPGDNPWNSLDGMDVTIYGETKPEQIIERAKEADILVINKIRITREIIDSLPKLKLLCVTATGYDIVDLKAASERKIPVCNVVAYGVDSVAQHVIALILELCRRCGLHDNLIHQNVWSAQKGWCFWETQQIELTGKTLGIAGFGNIGRRVAEIARAFGMNIKAWSRAQDYVPSYPEFEYVELDTLFRESDVLTLHCPLFPETREIVGEKNLALMKKDAFIINTARGGLVDDAALSAALKEGRIGGYAADVLSTEPPSSDHPLLHTPNTILTPHLAWASLQARKRITVATSENILSFLGGKSLKNVVNAKDLE